MKSIQDGAALLRWLIEIMETQDAVAADPRVIELQRDILASLKKYGWVHSGGLRNWLDLGGVSYFPNRQVEAVPYSRSLHEAWRTVLEEVAVLPWDEGLGTFDVLEIMLDWSDMRRLFKVNRNRRSIKLRKAYRVEFAAKISVSFR